MIDRDGALPSLWQTTTTKGRDSYSTDRLLPNSEPFEVIVVGGGITGMTTALLLQETGFRCALVEAGTLCFGATGGTTAHLNTVLDTPYTTISKNFGKEASVLVAQAAREAIRLVRGNCEKYSIDAGFEPQTAYIYSQTDEQSVLLEEMRKASVDAGVMMEYIDELPSRLPFRRAVSVGGQARFHPTRYVLGMARAFQAMGGRIFEHCRVYGAKEDIGITVHTRQGNLQCSHLVYATHIPPGVTLLNARCAPYRSYAIATTLRGEYPDGLIYDLEEPFHYYRTQVIDGQRYFIAGGEDHKTGHVANTEACFLKLESHVRKYFPVGEIKYRWSSQYFESADGLPYIGHMPGEPGHRYVASGFSGNGMVYGGVAALLFRDLLLQSAGKYIKLFDPNRIKPVAGFSNFVRENADVMKKWVGKLLPADKLRELADLAPGEGRVVSFEGENIALYKSSDGELKALSPTCRHMGCHVAWNDAEKTWDCPCHGARYAIDGTVVTGPANHDLEPISVAALIKNNG
jgi:glycine/D-amino acid oxidase-like deaminating enzyme/nitrite reductase/ring-hydroxylating ferredoxin subunit